MRCFRCGSLSVDVVGEARTKAYSMSFYECRFCGFFNHIQQRKLN